LDANIAGPCPFLSISIYFDRATIFLRPRR
jgi:hypothetical protein